MKQLQYRKRLRREYLRKKSGAYMSGVISGFLFVAALVLTVALGVFGIVALILRLLAVIKDPNLIFRDGIFQALTIVLVFIILGLAMLAMMFILCCSMWASWHLILDAKSKTQIPYVPPVTPDTLSAEEILVRGSTEPAIAQIKMLLRATRPETTRKEELLRVSQE